MPIDLASVSWLYVAILALFAFVATGIANLLSFNNRIYAAILSALLFAAAFIGWTYYPHGLPLPTAVAVQKTAPAVTAPPPATIQERPRNPVTTISPPR
jgi:drug/metabolite transporter (DMT)-like permease